MGIPSYLQNWHPWLSALFVADDLLCNPPLLAGLLGLIVLVGVETSLLVAGVMTGWIRRPVSASLPPHSEKARWREPACNPTQEALKQSESFNRAILTALPDLILRMRADGTYLDIKPTTAFPTEFPNFRVGENVRNVLPPLVAQQRLAMIAAALETGVMQVYEYPLTVQGQPLWQEARIMPLNAEEVLVVVRDLTQRKRMEEALQEREAMLRAIGDNLPKGYIYQIIHEPGKGRYYSYISAGVERLLGLKPEAVLADPTLIRQVGIAEDLDYADQVVQESVKNLTPVELQIRNRTATGKIQWSSIRSLPRRLPDGRVAWDGVEVDITELKQIEAALRTSEEQFRRAFDDAPIGVSLVSPTGQFIKMNRRYCELVGYSEAELLQLTFADITHPDDHAADLEGFRQLLAGEIPAFHMEKRYITKQGTILPVLLNTALVRDDQGQPLYSIGHVQDIRERQQVERMKDEFISVVSHELRTPLTSIRGALGILESGVFHSRPDKAQHMLHIALNNSDRLIRLVNDILTLERLQSGKVSLSMESCSVADLMQQAIDSVQALADEAHLSLHWQSLQVQVWAAPDAIIQTLTNLLSNAIKFSSPGSKVWLNAAAGSHHGLDHAILFTIQDQGRGIPASKLDLIFEQFQQVDVSDSRKKGGTGLGLAICRNIVEQHGGRIWVESTLGVGSTFFFTLPCHPQENSHGTS